MAYGVRCYGVGVYSPSEAIHYQPAVESKLPLTRTPSSSPAKRIEFVLFSQKIPTSGPA